jgi:L-lactate dehydrogenase (cytochrome)
VTIASASDFEAAARRRLPRMLYDYIAGGACDETTLRRNRDDFARLVLHQRAMPGFDAVDLTTRTLGQALSMPILLGPVGIAGLFARRGEAQAARAAAAAGTAFCLSSVGVCDVAEVRRAAPAPWFQLYLQEDPGHSAGLIALAREAGCPVLVLTVDAAVPGVRHRDARSGMGRPMSARTILDGLAHPAWLWDVWVRGRPHALGSLSRATGAARPRPIGPAAVKRALDWADLDWVRRHWDGPIMLKGILHPDDARTAVRAGADALVVSNHGGRQLDGASSTIAMVPAIVDAVGGAVDVFVDGGIRSGTDVLRALACGARACLLGRAWAFALAAAGQAGVAALLDGLRRELSTAMILAGCPSVAQAGAHLLREGAEHAPRPADPWRDAPRTDGPAV